MRGKEIMANSPEQMIESMLKNIEEKFGKPVDHWMKIAKESGIDKQKALINHLKEHGLTYGYANLIAQKTLNPDLGNEDGDELINAQYAGVKAELRPIYDSLIKSIVKFGGDVEVSPKKSYVSLRRSKQFALIQASTKTRVDVGLNLKGADATERLENSGSFNSMCSHRVRITDPAHVNKELIAWIKQAYEAA
jgi:predicted transport protein